LYGNFPVDRRPHYTILKAAFDILFIPQREEDRARAQTATDILEV
jgi:hypothetical protein